MQRHRSSASPLAWLYAGLIVYASLYPFSGWRVPGVPLLGFVTAPWPSFWTGFDLIANLIGYLPFGALVFGALVRTGTRARIALPAAVAAGALLSLAMEVAQNFLPQRVASNVDWGLNALGTLLGALLGYLVHVRGGVERWQRARDRWFIGRSAGGLALLLLWPFGLLLPLPVPFGVGQVLRHAADLVRALADGTALEPWLIGLPTADAVRPALSPAAELSLIAMGVVAPCLVAYTVSRPGWRRLVLAFGAVALGSLATTLSTALNFGPQHALAWATPSVLGAMAFGCALALLSSQVPRWVATGLALIALSALVTLVSQAPSDPYLVQSLQAWEQGRFIRFHGAARWVGWLWPYAAIAYLLVRLGQPDEENRTGSAARRDS